MLFLFNIILGALAPGQTPRNLEGKTITLARVAEINQWVIEDRFREFLRYVASKFFSTFTIKGRIVVLGMEPLLAAWIVYTCHRLHRIGQFKAENFRVPVDLRLGTPHGVPAPLTSVGAGLKRC